MEWIPHWNLQGKHAFLSPSGYSWLGYDEEKMARSYENKQNTARGTALHELASQLIMSKTELAPKKKALNLFVNDCIRDNMSSEVLLYYSDHCFGTADGIKWDAEANELRIYDLKTGVSKPSFKQLDIYAALFCLEYGVNPKKITIIQRLYQGNGYSEQVTVKDKARLEDENDGNIAWIMDHIKKMSKVLQEKEDEIRPFKFW